MGELEVVLDGEVVEEGPTLEDCVSEWASGASETIRGQLRQARAAYYARTQGIIQAFRKEVEISISTAYDYAKCWEKFGEAVENGDLSMRLESGSVTIYQLIECAYTPEPMEALEKAEEDNQTTRQIKREKREKQQEQAEKDHGKPEKLETRVCPTCGGDGVLPVAHEIFEVEYEG